MIAKRLVERTVVELADAERLSDSRTNEIRIPYRSKRHEGHTIGKRLAQLSRDRQSEPTLADATGAGQREQPNFWQAQ